MVTSPGATVALRNLHVPAYNPRRIVLDDPAFAEFKASILAQGVLQPILVRAVQGKKTPFEVVAGQRRFLASMEVFGQDYEIPVLQKEMTDAQAEAASAAENIEREDMSPGEEAEAAARVLARNNGDRVETAKMMGWSLSTLDNRLKLMACSELVRTRLAQRKIVLGMAEMLSGLTSVKQDEMVARFDTAGTPSVEDAKVLILAMTKSLPIAIFDKADCGTCAHNSARQQSMFDNIDEGHCLSSECYDTKTEQQLQATMEALKDDYQRVEIIRPGDNFRVEKLKIEVVGQEQATACRSCKDFGAAVSGLPNKQGQVIGNLCYGIECHKEKAAAFFVANLPPATESSIKGKQVEAPSGSQDPSTQGPDAMNAKGKTDAKEKPPESPSAPTIGLSTAVLDFRDLLYRKVVFKELATNPEFNARFVMAIMLNGQGRIISGPAIQAQFKKGGLISDGKSLHSLEAGMKIMMDVPKERALTMLPNLGAVAVEQLTREELKSLVILAKPDLALYFQLNDESGKQFLAKLTKNEITAICEEVGIAEKMGKTFRSISSGKKDEFIKQITSVQDFEYKGKVPKVLKPRFEK